MGFRNVLLLAMILTSLLSSKVFAQAELSSRDAGYIQQAFVVDRALRMNFGSMRISDETMPADTEAVRSLFVRICEPSVQNYRYQKKLVVSKTGEITLLNFQCETKDDFSTQSQMVQFVASVDDRETLLDLQVLQAGNADLHSDFHKWSSKDAGEVLVAVAAGTLASGLLAKGLYPNQQDKILHAIAGNLIAVAAALISYYGFDVSKNQAFWIGLASGILAGLLKEAYDSQHRDKHSVEAADVAATGVGGLTGALVIRLKFNF